MAQKEQLQTLRTDEPTQKRAPKRGFFYACRRSKYWGKNADGGTDGWTNGWTKTDKNKAVTNGIGAKI